MSGAKWSVDEIGRLHALYPYEPRWKKLLPQFPGRSKAAIRCKVQTLDIHRATNSRVPWLSSEKIALRKLWPSAKWPEISAAIPRHSKSAIGKQASSMKIVRTDKAKQQSRYSIIRDLRAIRKASGASAGSMAVLIGTHWVRLQRWESEYDVPRLASFFDWVEALGYRLRLERIR